MPDYKARFADQDVERAGVLADVEEDDLVSHELLDLLGALEDVHGLSMASGRLTRVREHRC